MILKSIFAQFFCYKNLNRINDLAATVEKEHEVLAVSRGSESFAHPRRPSRETALRISEVGFGSFCSLPYSLSVASFGLSSTSFWRKILVDFWVLSCIILI